jgi:DNA-directed RNA polymerase specialized sigma24 family protein
MVVKNEKLIELFKVGKNGDWNPFFKKVEDVISYTIANKFSNIKYYYYDTEALYQDCLLKIWELILKEKIKENGNIFSYIIGSVSFLLRDVIRKETRRRGKAVIINVENNILHNLKLT